MTSGRELRRHFALAALLAAPVLFAYATIQPTVTPQSGAATAARNVAEPIAARPDATLPADPRPSPAPAFESVKSGEVAIEGTVVAPDGTPVDMAQILLQLDDSLPARRNPRAFTDTDGKFHVAVPADRPVVLRVFTPTLPPHGFRYPVARVRVPAGGTKDLIVRLQPGATIAGRVVDSNGVGVYALNLRTAVPGAMSSGSYIAAETVTAADGAFAFDGLPDGFFTIEEDRPAGSAADHALLDAFFVADGTTGLSLRRLPVVAVTGRVIDADGRPAAQRTVVLVRKGAALTVETRTDATGSFRANVAAPGRYSVRLRVATQSGHTDLDMGVIDASSDAERPFVEPKSP